jgi:uncharacterized repeat protein (TIGR03803 family)
MFDIDGKKYQALCRRSFTRSGRRCSSGIWEMSRLSLPHHRFAKLLSLAIAVATLALLIGCSGTARASFTLRLLHAFGGADGAWPRGSLVVTGGFLYGATTAGGRANSGTIFRVRPDGTDFQSLYSFTAGGDNGLGNQPHHNSLLLVGSELIGATRRGGNTKNEAGEGARKSGNGTLFRIDTNGSGYTVLQQFDGGARSPSSQHSSPQISPDGRMLYGMSAGGGKHHDGTLYEMRIDGTGFRMLHHFDKSRGKGPHGMVVFDGPSTLLGMTRSGGRLSDGSEGAGVIFRYDLKTREYKVLHIFAKNASDNGDTNDHGFLNPAGGYYYGVTELGGRYDQGVIFRLRADGSDFSIVHSFGARGDGKKPFGSLVLVGEWFYGTTTVGGDHDDGTLFRLRPSDLRYEKMVSFDRSITGAFPEDNVIPAGDGSILYGLTQAGGVNDPTAAKNYGTVFAVILNH